MDDELSTLVDGLLERAVVALREPSRALTSPEKVRVASVSSGQWKGQRRDKDWGSWLGAITKSNKELSVKDLALLLKSQGFKCALSGLKLTHKTKDLCSCAVDRIDYSGGWIVGNVHLVCFWVARARGGRDIDEFKEVIRRLKEGK